MSWARRRAACLGVGLVLLLSGCGFLPKSGSTASGTATASSTVSQIPPAAVPDGWVYFVDQAVHFSVSVPGTWVRFDLTSTDGLNRAKQYVTDNPKTLPGVSTTKTVSTLLDNGLRFGAFGPDGTSVGFVSKGGVAPPNMTTLPDTYKAQFEKNGLTVDKVESATLAGLPAVRFDLTTSKTGNGATVTASQTLIYAVVDDRLVTIQFVKPGAEMSQILDTVRFA